MSFIETGRLLIRKWDIARDAADAAEFFGDPQTMRFIPAGPLAPESVKRLLARFIERDERDGFGIWPVVHRADRRVIGECGVTYIPGYGKDIEIAWIFNRAYHGSGYASEAARAVSGWAFSQIALPRLYALIDRENAPSIGVARRLGMTFDRIVRAYNRDLMRYVKERP